MKNFFSPLLCNFRLKSFTAFTIFILLSWFMMPSCIKEEDFDFNKIAAFNYELNGAAPIIHSNLTLRNILNDYDTNHLFVDDQTGYLRLVYNASVFSKRADQIIKISDQTVNTSFTFSPGAIPINDSVSAIHISNYTFATTHNERYDSIRIKAGSLNFNINSNLNHNSRIDITIPNAKKNGAVFRKSILCPYTGIPMNISKIFDLSDYTINFDAGNQITINYKITAFGDGNPDLFVYNINMGESFQNIAYKAIFGYLGDYDITTGNNDSVMVELFKNNIYGKMHFEDPRLHLYVNNSFGMPLKVDFNSLEAHSSVNSPYNIPIQGIGFTNPWTIEAPTQPGQNKQSTMTLKNDNSNLVSAIDISPEWVTGTISASSNPSGNPATDHNFVLDTSRFSLDAEVELPLYGYVKDFRLQDTLELGLGDDVDKADWIKFRINTDNWFPIEASVQVYFVNSDSLDSHMHYYIVDSLFTIPAEQIVAAAPVGPADAYRTTAPSHKLVDIMFYKDRLTALKNNNVDMVLVQSKLATTNSNNNALVKIYSDYSVDVKIGAQVQGHNQVTVKK